MVTKQNLTQFALIAIALVVSPLPQAQEITVGGSRSNFAAAFKSYDINITKLQNQQDKLQNQQDRLQNKLGTLESQLSKQDKILAAINACSKTGGFYDQSSKTCKTPVIVMEEKVKTWPGFYHSSEAFVNRRNLPSIDLEAFSEESGQSLITIELTHNCRSADKYCSGNQTIKIDTTKHMSAFAELIFIHKSSGSSGQRRGRYYYRYNKSSGKLEHYFHAYRTPFQITQMRTSYEVGKIVLK